MIVFLLASPIVVRADIISGNDFLYELKKNGEKVEELGTWYYGKRFSVNSPSGYVIPKEKPGSEKGVTPSGYYPHYSDKDKPYKISHKKEFVFINGETIIITHTYLHNGEYWGVMPPTHSYQPPGWVLMDDLLMIYDQQDFEEENTDKFYTYTGSYDAVLSAKRLVVWQWPGSDKEKRIIDEKDTIIECANVLNKYVNVLYAYKDNEGREWSNTAIMDGWICLSDPQNSSIPAFHPALQSAKWSSDGIYDWSSNDVTIWPPVDVIKLLSFDTTVYSFDKLLLIIAIIAVLVADAVVLIKVFRKLDKTKQEGDRDD